MKINKNRPAFKASSKTPVLNKEGNTLSVSDRVSISFNRDKGAFAGYNKVGFKAVSEEGIPEKSRRTDPDMVFSDVLNAIDGAVYKTGNSDDKLYNADGNISGAKDGIQSSYYDIRNVQYDDEEKNVSSSGYNLETTFWSVNGDLREGNGNIDSAGLELYGAGQLIIQAHKDLDNLILDLNSSGGNEHVVSLIKNAQNFLVSSAYNAGGAGDNISRADGEIADSQNEMSRADTNVDAIKWDDYGKDVSSEGYELEDRVGNVEWNLGDADREVSSARNGLYSLEGNLKRAASAVRNAQSAYNSMRKKKNE